MFVRAEGGEEGADRWWGLVVVLLSGGLVVAGYDGGGGVVVGLCWERHLGVGCWFFSEVGTGDFWGGGLTEGGWRVGSVPCMVGVGG